jgi:hypothetical protein
VVVDLFVDGRLRQRWDDSTSTYTEWDADGQVTLQRPYNPSEEEAATKRAVLAALEANRATLRDQARQALTVNRAYLDLTSPTQSQVVAQVRALTQQAIGLIRLAGDFLDGTN